MIQLILMGGRIERKISAGSDQRHDPLHDHGQRPEVHQPPPDPARHRALSCTTSGMVKVSKAIFEEEGEALPRGAEPDPDPPHPLLPGHHEGAEVSRGDRGHRAAAPRALGRAGLPAEAEGGGHQPRRADRLRGGCLHRDDQQAAAPQLDDRLQRDEERAERQRAPLRPEDPEGLPGEHGDLPHRQHRPAQQLRHRPGDADTYRRRPCVPWWSSSSTSTATSWAEREIVDLLARKALFIVKAVDPKSLAPARDGRRQRAGRPRRTEPGIGGTKSAPGTVAPNPPGTVAPNPPGTVAR